MTAEQDDLYDELFKSMARRIDLEAQLAENGLYVLREGEAWMNGKTWRFERAECAEFGECWLRSDGDS